MKIIALLAAATTWATGIGCSVIAVDKEIIKDPAIDCVVLIFAALMITVALVNTKEYFKS